MTQTKCIIQNLTQVKYYNDNLLLHTVAVESPESSVATFKPFERVVTLVSGTLYNDCNNRKKSEILIGKKYKEFFLCVSNMKVGKIH